MGIQPDPNAGEGIGSGGINEIGGAGGGPAPTADHQKGSVVVFDGSRLNFLIVEWLARA